MSDADETLGRYIRRLRKQQGLTQDTLARSVGITKAYVCIIERGDRTGRPVTVAPAKLSAIAGALRVPAEQLFNRANILPEGTRLVRPHQPPSGGDLGGGEGGEAGRQAIRGAAAAAAAADEELPGAGIGLDREAARNWNELRAAGYTALPPSVQEEIKHYIEFRARQLRGEGAE